MTLNQNSVKYFYGICKQVNQPDSIVIREKPVNGPPPTKNLMISNITCPRIQFRPQNNNSPITYDEPFAWEAREFLRRKIVGQEVIYTENKMPKGGIVGDVYIGKVPILENNVAYLMVAEGFAEVRKLNNPDLIAKNKLYQDLIEAENSAKAALKGRWNPNESAVPRAVCWNIPEPTEFLNKMQGRELNAVVEFVRDGSSLQVCLLPDPADKEQIYYPVFVSLAGIRAPSSSGGKAPDSDPAKLADKAKFFVETRLLQKDVKVRLLSTTTGGQNFLGMVLHPRGDICEFLLAEGLATRLDWGMDSLPPASANAYRAREQEAKEQTRNIWANYKPPAPPSEAQLKIQKQRTALQGSQLTGSLVEVGLGDNVTVKCDNGQIRKLYLSSIRPLRPNMEPVVQQDGAAAPAPQPKVTKPLYDIPYMFEAREFLRKHIGKRVQVHIDYTLPKPENAAPGSNMEDRVCATVEVVNGPNLAQGLISRGLAQLVRYRRNGTDPRAKCYDLLQAAEEEAITKAVGWHSKGSAPQHKVTEVTGNHSKALLPTLQRAGKLHGVVEFVATAGRFKVFIPQFNNTITLLLAGVDYSRPGRSLPNGRVEPGDPLGEEATQFSREHCLQRNVDFEVDSLDKAGNFIGKMNLHQHFAVQGPLKPGDAQIKNLQASGHVVSKELNVILVLQGYATVSWSAKNSKLLNHPVMLKAQNEAQSAKNGLWKNEQFLAQWNATQQQQQEARAAAAENHLAEELTKSASLKEANSSEVDWDEAKMQAALQERVKNAKPAYLLQASLGESATDWAVRVYMQSVEDAPKLVEIANELNSKSPSAAECASFKPQKGQMCAVKYSEDNKWYRAQITQINQNNVISVLFVDYGNEEDVDLKEHKDYIGPLSAKLAQMPLITRQYRLSGLCMPPDVNDRYAAAGMLAQVAGEASKLLMHVESSQPVAYGKDDKKPVPTINLLQISKSSAAGSSAGSAAVPSPLSDIGELLLRKGMLYVDRGRMPRDQRARYELAQSEARKSHLNIWRHGDCRPDE